jgi:hypothetical protein
MMSAETPPVVYGPRVWYGAAGPTPNSTHGSVQLPPSPLARRCGAGEAVQRGAVMKCALCQNFSGPREICCACLGIAFPHCVPPEWVRQHLTTEALVPEPIS